MVLASRSGLHQEGQGQAWGLPGPVYRGLSRGQQGTPPQILGAGCQVRFAPRPRRSSAIKRRNPSLLPFEGSCINIFPRIYNTPSKGERTTRQNSNPNWGPYPARAFTNLTFGQRIDTKSKGSNFPRWIFQCFVILFVLYFNETLPSICPYIITAELNQTFQSFERYVLVSIVRTDGSLSNPKVGIPDE